LFQESPSRKEGSKPLSRIDAKTVSLERPSRLTGAVNTKKDDDRGSADRSG
jgi:hypothetical protein